MKKKKSLIFSRAVTSATVTADLSDCHAHKSDMFSLTKQFTSILINFQKTKTNPIVEKKSDKSISTRLVSFGP